MIRTDAGTPTQSSSQCLFILRAADFTLTTDQQFIKNGNFTNYIVSGIVANRKSGAFGTACLGGVYSAASKGGDPIVAATQVWTGLSGANKMVVATLAALALTNLRSETPYLALSTGNTGALTADVFIYGVILD